MRDDQVLALREAVCLHARKMWQSGLVAASQGNASARAAGSDLIAVTPSSIPYEGMTAEQIVIVSLTSGNPMDAGAHPSSELLLHLAIYRAREDVGAILHTHSPFVSVLSVLHRRLPPVIDEMIVYFGGTIEVAPYAFTGTEQLAENAVAALADRGGVILSNHGNVCVGSDLATALQVALTMESTARVYVEAFRTGDPALLPEDSLRAGRALYEKRRQQASQSTVTP